MLPGGEILAMALLLLTAVLFILGKFVLALYLGSGAAGSAVLHRLSLRDVLLALQIAVCALLVTASLVSLHPLARLEDVVENTGFTLHIPEEVPLTSLPSEEELRLLREEIDPKGVYLRLFGDRTRAKARDYIWASRPHKCSPGL